MPRVVLTNQPVPSGNTGVIQSLLSASIHLLFKHSPGHPNLNSEVRVTYGTIGPMLLYGGNSTAGYNIYLTAENIFWSQHLYQFSHEACHVYAQSQSTPFPHCNQWFEESLCEMSSLYCIKIIAALGAQNQGPCPISYHQSLGDYAERIINSPDRIYDDQLQKWFRNIEPDLRRDSYIRCLNGVVANKLLPIFMATPSNWAAVEFLNAKPCADGHDSFAEYLDNWQAATPNEHHSIINQVRSLLI